MTTVHVSMARDDGTGTLAAVAGSLYWEPTTRREDGTVVVLPQGFPMSLVAGEASEEVAPSGLTWCWRVTERVEDGTVRYVAVPDSAETVEYTDLVDVDPDTLVEWSPADPEAAYTAALAAKVDEPDAEGTDGQALTTDGAGGRTWTTIAGGVTSVDGETGAVSLSDTYVPQTRTINGQALTEDITIATASPATVFFGDTAATARPTSDAPVIWVGYTGTTPTNATANFDLVFTFDAPAVTPDFEYLTNAQNLTIQSTFTFSALTLGDEAADRSIIVATAGFNGSLGNGVASISVGGVSATIDAHFSEKGKNFIAIAHATVPTGLTGDVTVTIQDDNAFRCAVAIWRASGALTAEDFDANGTNSATVTATEGGLVVAAGYTVEAAAPPDDRTWTGITEHFDTELGGRPFTGGAVTDATAGDVTASWDATADTNLRTAAVAYSVA